MATLSDSEVFILDQLSKKSSISQRELAQKIGISLGQINVILKKFLKTNFIKVAHVNKRKMEYLLTPQGVMETNKRSHRLLTNTVKNFNKLKSNLSLFLRELHQSGYDYFSIHGDGELKELIESTFRTCLEEKPVTLGKEHRSDPRAVVLNVTLEPIQQDFKGDVISVLEKICL